MRESNTNTSIRSIEKHQGRSFHPGGDAFQETRKPLFNVNEARSLLVLEALILVFGRIHRILSNELCIGGQKAQARARTLVVGRIARAENDRRGGLIWVSIITLWRPEVGATMPVPPNQVGQTRSVVATVCRATDPR
jgi:hypothetical protein